MKSTKPVIFSGIQPTGNLHVGNYLGAVKNWVELQNSGKYDCYFCIVDYHSLTGNQGADERRVNTLNLATELLAAGIDPKKSTLFVQSAVPQCTELAWIFNTITPVSELYRMTQFKDKSEHQEKNINVGLLTYPILQAADILLYHGNLVPVGQDQVQHVELTRDIARWFNNRYGNYFPETKVLLTEIPKVMSLLEPTKKMSKSHGLNSVIELADEPEIIMAKLKKAVTATSGGELAPGVANLLLLLKQFDDKKVFGEFVSAEQAGSIRYGDLKIAVAEAIARHFAGFRAERKKYLKNSNKLKAILNKGAKKARIVAGKTMKDVRKLVGIR
ncbi:MAG: tryptophan--tRNA ligase [Candidatus Magasanikbacteria bacterium RIFCSPHIGHO2_01_FULL_41_23]|uniref:Tryptophan--tRNA ligase n=1 Tax=Candidatus Magasanikbacteria bacterium RIFCSPLOWO2_01_FULL_40_15 TaxID=1798686 RepID=A0A1F6N4C3_9BACT|nr:MAG: tryptophan--tRNA ligase [Candidatus Magasanikbacteria bacterium RIFCSPHIGHO2_01_FULL_41_23]OGH67188.1 MAG: tryptophan--tRNA ligase [Candidatus Magasanikbacteria bacterium RIFCSPHIGHO2_02_FULL_41_35]OGH75447.1 MAG: tryptophan--tRNA ligase [Candidatus Magasanikbacteria bacterium RIFCSPHIGHO2_12_FULL_41_16]OGH78724.1 MAG: tryptophan--tRNA ligase [Candidatus Magasanikbacteria bacterium RIFCSPLOWO2_01_FULL_40_15]